MPATGPLHPQSDDGTALDATFELSTVHVFELVYHHKAGARGSPRSLNADYHAGLELLLGRLAQLRMTILGISVDSSVARELAPEERELALSFPIRLNPAMDVHDLRLSITRAQRPIARRPQAKDRGNDQKRIRLTLRSGDAVLGYDRLRAVLVMGSDIR